MPWILALDIPSAKVMCWMGINVCHGLMMTKKFLSLNIMEKAPESITIRLDFGKLEIETVLLKIVKYFANSVLLRLFKLVPRSVSVRRASFIA